MFHVVYVSRASAPMQNEELLDLLQCSRSRNNELLLTGLLLYAGGRFMQVLEGREAAVREVFTSIQRDSRHTDIHTLKLQAVEQRLFPDWSMAFENLDVATQGQPGVSRFLDPGFSSPTLADESSDVYQLLRAFRSETAKH